MGVKSLVFALGFAVVACYYFEHSVVEVMKAVSQWRDGPRSDKPPH